MTDEDMDGFMAVEQRLRARVRTLEDKIFTLDTLASQLVKFTESQSAVNQLLIAKVKELEEARSE